MPPPLAPGTTRVLPMQLRIGDGITDSSGEWEVVGRPYTTNGGKNAHVRVQRVNQPGVTEIARHLNPDRCQCFGPGGRPIPQPLTTTRDIEDGSGSLVGPLVQDRIGRVGEDQEFSRRTRRIGSRDVYTAAQLESLLSAGLRRGSASRSGP